MTNRINSSVKGVSRQYRKALRKIGLRNFPLSGAFHCRDNGITVRPEQVTRNSTVKAGPAPLVIWRKKGMITNENLSDDPIVICKSSIEPAPVCPALTVEPVFRRVESIAVRNGKECKRSNYRPVKNAKAGQTVWVKRDVNGKPKWVSVNYSDLLNPVNVAS